MDVLNVRLSAFCLFVECHANVKLAIKKEKKEKGDQAHGLGPLGDASGEHGPNITRRSIRLGVNSPLIVGMRVREYGRSIMALEGALARRIEAQNPASCPSQGA